MQSHLLFLGVGIAIGIGIGIGFCSRDPGYAVSKADADTDTDTDSDTDKPPSDAPRALRLFSCISRSRKTRRICVGVNVTIPECLT